MEVAEIPKVLIQEVAADVGDSSLKILRKHTDLLIALKYNNESDVNDTDWFKSSIRLHSLSFTA